MIACPKCGSKEMEHERGDDCHICGTHSCIIECSNRECKWKGTFDELVKDVKDPPPRPEYR